MIFAAFLEIKEHPPFDVMPPSITHQYDPDQSQDIVCLDSRRRSLRALRSFGGLLGGVFGVVGGRER